MRIRRLQTRFFLAGCLLVATTIICGLWSAWTFAHLSAAVDQTLRQGQQTVDLSAGLAGILEREDDALLLGLTGDRERARAQLLAQRKRFAEAHARLLPLLNDPDEEAAAADLQLHAGVYRRASDTLLAAAATAGPSATYRKYHQEVNPALRRAVADCERIREVNFRSMQEVGIRARDEANNATLIVAALSLAALCLSALVALGLARAVLRPVQQLRASVDALRLGNFESRVQITSADELGQLAEGFNRMAETLAEYRSSSLGDLLVAKGTLEATLNALPDAVIVVDPDETIVALNPPARVVLSPGGVKEGDRVERLPLAPEHLEAVREALQGRSSTKNRTEFSRSVKIQLDGSERKFLPTAVPIPQFAPKRFGAVVVLDDVTDVARLDELRSELVGVASHELKTPLTTLRMNLLLLAERDDVLTPSQREMLAAALQGCEELGSTIDELLDLTRIEAGQLRLAHDRIDLLPLIDRVVRSLRPRFEDAAISLSVHSDPPSAITQGDAPRLAIVFANLLGNALKYTPCGGSVAVRILSGPSAGTNGDRPLQITVTDTGPGIPPEFRERIFEKFFRVEHHRSGDGKSVRGTGIGLYLCRQIIALHGGTIHCEPGDGGRGTRIVLQLRAEAPYH
jgi:NtrC-family two-component system sensor histidine kinase KinB